MRTATADVALKGLRYFRHGWIWVLLEKRDAAHDHAGSAVGALKSAEIEKSLLHGMQPAVAFQAFDGGDGFFDCGAERHLAGAPGRAVDQDGAGAALALPTTVLATGESEFVAKSRKKSGIRVGFNRVRFAVYLE